MKISRCIFFALSLFALAFSQAQNAEEYFKLGCDSFTAADYPKAYDDFAKSSALNETHQAYYNLALSAQKLGKTGEAELYFMRALKLQPRMREAEAALELLRSGNSISSPFNEKYEDFFDQLSEGEWMLACVAFFWIGLAALVLPPLFGKRGPASLFVFFTCIVFFAVCASGIFYWTEFSRLAVAVSPDSTLRLSPAKNAPVSAVMQEGDLAQIRDTHGSFMRVVSADGKEGWAEVKDVRPVSKAFEN